MKMYLPSSFILVRAEMNVHAFMNELDQKDYWYPRTIYKLWKCTCNVYKVNGELSSCDITYSGRFSSREGDNRDMIHNFAYNHLELLNGLSISAQTFTVGFVKLLSTHPIHIVVWGNFNSPLMHWFNAMQKLWRVKSVHVYRYIV